MSGGPHFFAIERFLLLSVVTDGANMFRTESFFAFFACFYNRKVFYSNLKAHAKKLGMGLDTKMGNIIFHRFSRFFSGEKIRKNSKNHMKFFSLFKYLEFKNRS